MVKCFCGSIRFQSFNGRPLSQCSLCNSVERHRDMYRYIEWNRILRKKQTILHIAPEKGLYQKIIETTGRSNYFCADKDPNIYKNISKRSCIEIDISTNSFPFEKSFFDLIIHNHVLEHLSGSYKDHLSFLIALLKKEGRMIFTIPEILFPKTVEYGENLSSDQERIRFHGQHDHVKTFGFDFIEYFNSLDYKTIVKSQNSTTIFDLTK